MASVSVVETDEVAAVEGQENSLLGDGEGQVFGIGNGSAGVSSTTGKGKFSLAWIRAMG